MQETALPPKMLFGVSWGDALVCAAVEGTEKEKTLEQLLTIPFIFYFQP